MHNQQFTSENGDRSNAPNVAIIVTDGMATREVERTQPDAQRAQDDGIEMVSIGITSAVDLPTLQFLSSDPKRENENFFRSTNFMTLGDIVHGLIQRVRCYVPTNPPRAPCKGLLKQSNLHKVTINTLSQ